MHAWPDLRPILAGIPWAVTGAVATRAYTPERATQDLDILLSLASDEDLAGVRTLMKRHTSGELEDLESLIDLGRIEMGKN